MPILRSRLADELARNRDAWREQAQLTREVMRRTELVLGNLVSVTSDLRDESRAHTQAVFRMIDVLDERLPPNPR